MLGRHRLFLILLVLGVALRVAMRAAYSPAFGYFDDTLHYLVAATTMTPDQMRPFGTVPGDIGGVDGGHPRVGAQRRGEVLP